MSESDNAAIHAVKDAVVRFGSAAIARCDSGRGDIVASLAALEVAISAAVDTPAGANLRQMLAMLETPEEEALLSLLAAPHLDEKLSRAWRQSAAAASDDNVAASMGFVLRLASGHDDGNEQLAALFADERALCRRHLVRRDAGTSSAAARLTIAPVVVSVFAAEAITPPDGTMVEAPLDPELATAACNDIGLWPLRPALTLLTAPAAAADSQYAVAHLMVAAAGARMWHVPSPHQDWPRLLLESAIAGAVVVTSLADASEALVEQIGAASTATGWPVVGANGPERGAMAATGKPRLDLPISLEHKRVAAAYQEQPELRLALTCVLKAFDRVAIE